MRIRPDQRAGELAQRHPAVAGGSRRSLGHLPEQGATYPLEQGAAHGLAHPDAAWLIYLLA